MEYKVIKNSDIKVSRVCVGGCAMGGHGWGTTDRNELIKTVKQAIDMGINFFDTADVYGLGESEKVLGEALKGNRHNAVIATKFGVKIDREKGTFYDNSPEWIEESLKGSLKRLNTDYIDLYQVHYRDGKTSINTIIETLEKLKKEGYIRHYGLSNIYNRDIEDLKQAKSLFVSFQNEYSLANRENEEDIINISKNLGCTPLTWGSLGQGILTGKYNKNTVFSKNDRRSREVYKNFHGEKLEHNLKIVDLIKKISKEIGKDESAIAIRWILDYLKDSIVIAGVKNRNQLESNALALGWELDKEHIKSLEKISRWK